MCVFFALFFALRFFYNHDDAEVAPSARDAPVVMMGVPTFCVCVLVRAVWPLFFCLFVFSLRSGC
jgi:hypothetical protein